MESDASDELDEDDGDADADENSDISDILGTSMSIGRHAFSQMEVDVDKQRRERKRDEQLNADDEQHRLQWDD